MDRPRLAAASRALLVCLISGVAISLAVWLAWPGAPVFPPTAPAGTRRVRFVDLIPRSLSGEENDDSEPFLAVDYQDPRRMVVTAFTPNPAGMDRRRAPIFTSDDAGETWRLENLLPTQGMHWDATVAFGGESLYAGILSKQGSELDLKVISAEDSGRRRMLVRGSPRAGVDQPFIVAMRVSSRDRLYLGYNDLAAREGKSATIGVSADGAGSLRQVPIEMRVTPPGDRDGASVRPAVARDGTVYAAFFGWRERKGAEVTSDVVVMRDDHGALGVRPFEDLRDLEDHQPGIRVAHRQRIPLFKSLVWERINCTLALAVDPRRSSIVYLAWADQTVYDIHTLHLVYSINRGQSWSGDLLAAPSATTAALAVADDGTVGLLYQQLEQGSWWVTRLEQRRDGHRLVSRRVLARVPASKPLPNWGSYLGDYGSLVAVRREFRGVFAANNDPQNLAGTVKYQRRVAGDRLVDEAGRPVAVSIDPIYFSVPVAHEH
jgi:hypothetical protein